MKELLFIAIECWYNLQVQHSLLLLLFINDGLTHLLFSMIEVLNILWLRRYSATTCTVKSPKGNRINIFDNCSFSTSLDQSFLEQITSDLVKTPASLTFTIISSWHTVLLIINSSIYISKQICKWWLSKNRLKFE